MVKVTTESTAFRQTTTSCRILCTTQFFFKAIIPAGSLHDSRLFFCFFNFIWTTRVLSNFSVYIPNCPEHRRLLGQSRRRRRLVSWLLHWCFKPSQPQMRRRRRSSSRAKKRRRRRNMKKCLHLNSTAVLLY